MKQWAVQMAQGGVAVGLLLILPIWYLLRMVRRRQWSLSWLLGLPLVVGLWMLVWQSHWLHTPGLVLHLLNGAATWMCGTALLIAIKSPTDGQGNAIRLTLSVGTLLVFSAFVMKSFILNIDPTVQYTFGAIDLLRAAMVSLMLVSQFYWLLRAPVSFFSWFGGLFHRNAAA